MNDVIPPEGIMSTETRLERVPLKPGYSGSLADVLDQLSYSRVEAADLDNPVYRLRYEAYRREEFVPFSEAGIVHDDLDKTENCYAYGVFIGGELVSSVRIHLVSRVHPHGPSMKTHADVLQHRLDAGETFVDPSRFTADLDASLAYPGLPHLTLRIAVMATDYFNATSCLALVRREHVAFYRRTFGSIEIGQERVYPGLSFSTVLLDSNAAVNLQAIYRRFPFYRSSQRERQALFGQTPATRFNVPVMASGLDEIGSSAAIAAQ